MPRAGIGTQKIFSSTKRSSLLSSYGTQPAPNSITPPRSWEALEHAVEHHRGQEQLRCVRQRDEVRSSVAISPIMTPRSPVAFARRENASTICRLTLPAATRARRAVFGISSGSHGCRNEKPYLLL
jgi:hypothetical protein